MAFEIVVVGSCNTDLISYVSRLPKMGETISGESFQMGFGGKGANQCTAASRLGASVAMVGKVGTDIFGDQYIENFKNNGVSTDYISRSSSTGTGKASITVDKQGNNSIVIVEGANKELSISDVEAVEEVIKEAKVLVCQLEIQQDVTLAALKLAKKHNVFTILNPAPVPQCGLNKELFKYTDVICPNETEAQQITCQSFATLDHAISSIPQLVKLGAPVSIVTLGDQGCIFCCKGSSEVKTVPALKVNAIDTTGAGDAFVGSLAYCMSRRVEGNVLGLEKVEEMTRVACGVASLCVQQRGTQVSFPRMQSMPGTLVSQIYAL